MSLEQTIRELYESEISTSLDAIYQKPLLVCIYYDADNEWLSKEFQIADLNGAAEWLKSTAIQLYPESEFARKNRE